VAVLATSAHTDADVNDFETAEGYVCQVWYSPPNPGTPMLGRYGHVFVRVSADCHAPANDEASAYFCSHGAEHEYACAPEWLYSERALLNLHASVQRALIQKTKIRMRYDDHAPYANAGRTVEFFAQ